MSESSTAVRELVGVQLGQHEVRSEDRLIEDLGAESADLVNLLVALEDRFRVAIGEEQAAALQTVADVEDLVARLLEPECPPGP